MNLPDQQFIIRLSKLHIRAQWVISLWGPYAVNGSE